jgi:pimeloyl-ACP methyl ester carboxylesterase
LIEALELSRPLLVSHDWGAAIVWIFAHRYSNLIGKLVVVNCTHAKTLMRAVVEFEDFQTFRSLYALVLQVPLIPELVFATAIGGSSWNSPASCLKESQAKWIEL